MPAAGDIAIIGYNSAQTSAPVGAAQSLTFVVLRPLAAGTVIYFTDRTWNGTSFSGSGTDGTFSYTVPGGGLAAGTVITPPLTGFGGTEFANSGEAIYVYTGTDADTPTTFLFALEFADGNSTFAATLTNTGLLAGVSAVSVPTDIGSYHGPTNGGGAEYFMRQISDAQNWAGDDIDGQQAHPHPVNSLFQVAPDFQLWVTGAGGGDGLVKVDGDGTISGGNLGHNINRLYTDFQSGGNDLLYRPADITFDTVHGKYYIADSDLNGHNRILQGSIADLFNPAATPTLTVLFNNTATDATGRIDHMEVDPQTGSVYFTLGSGFWKVSSDTANQAGTQLANFGTGSGNPIGTASNFFNDMVINFATGDVYFTSTRVLASAGGDSVQKNYLYRISGLDNADGAGAFTFGGGNITVMPFSPQDNEVGTGTNNTGEAFPKEFGTLDGLAIDTVNNILYFSTGEVLLDDDQNSGTAPTYHPGGIYAYALTGNAAGTYTVVWQQTSGQGPQGILSDLEIDVVTGRWYVLDTTGTSGVTAGDGEGIWSGNLNGTGTPVLFSTVHNESGLTGIGLHLNRAPTMTTGANGSLVATEASTGLGSGTSTAVDFIAALDVTDFENADQTDQLAGASVWIATNLQSGDQLTINGTTSGSSGGISWSYDSATGVMSLTGVSTFDAYETLLQTARFTVSGDNPTAYGTATNRVINWTVSDGILNADAGTATVTVTGINDAPVNSVGAGGSIAEDVGGPLAITGISVSDVDADPATQDITVTLTAEFGVLTVLTNVSGGLVAGEVSGNGTATVTLTGTQNQINAVLAATNGLVLSGIPANFNGGIDITVVTNDGGFNGNDPGLTGTGTTEQDSDVRVITVTAVNDAPTVAGDGTETAVQVTEDSSSNSLTQTFSSLLSGQYSDAADDQFANGGTSAGAFAGVAVIANGSAAGVGQWQAWNGASWVNIGTASEAAAQTFSSATPFRFSPAANFNGPAPTLTVVLIDSSFIGLVFGGDVDVSTRGGTTSFSTGTVVISQPNITAVNDAPTVTGGSAVTLLAVSEDSTNPAGDTVANIFGSRFSDAADNVSGGSAPNTFAGIMIGINNSNGAQGVWQVFSGGSWFDLPALSPTNTYLVSASDSLRFVPAPNYNGTPGTLVVLLIDDSSGAVVTGTRLDSSITGSGGTTVYSNSTMTLGTSITAANDAPAVNADTTAAFTEGAGAVAVTPAFTVTDIDNANLTGATISVSDFVAGDLLGFTDQNGITGVYNSGTGVLTLSGTATVANYQAAIRSITYDHAGDANVGGTDNSRTINITVTDGVTPSSQTATVISITDGGGDAQDDAFSTTESTAITAGDLLANNGSGADTGVSDITDVNGNPITYGVQFALPSGALLTVYANGTFDYDPNGVYDSLVDASAGAGNSVATDTFTYTVDGGDVATVTITINGETDSGDIYVGTGGADTITGSGTGNTVNAGGGNDTVNGLGGGDVINGEAGDDTLNGGDQADKLNGGDDNDLLNGEEGNDILSGGAGADDLVGGNGNDTLDGGAGADDMNGGDGSDIYFVDDAGDTITDSSGIDTVRSTGTYILGAGLEHLTLLGAGDSDGTGNASNNTINGNAGVNILSGMDGADKLYGFGGKDVLNGGAGNDVIDGGDSNDVVNAGADNDTVAGGSGNDILNGDDGNDQLDGGVGADKLFGGVGIDQLTGGLGNDYMYGGDGVDTMNGNDGNDYLDGGVGPDKMYGGVGNDVYIVNEYNDFILENVGEGFDVVRSFASYVMGENLEALELQAGAGDIAGTGNNAANTITGNEGVNVLDGKGGVDTIKGGDGNDVIFGGLGNDLLYGQAGWDVFAVRQESVSLMTLETDRIFDLDIAGGDRVDLSAIDADSTTMGNQAFQFAAVLSTFSGVAGEATLTYDVATASTFLRLDVNGDKKADYSLRIDGDHTGTSGNIIAPGAFLDGSGGWIL